MKIEERNIDSVRPWENNPRSITKTDMARLIEQLKRHKQYKPLIVNIDGEILGGNMRWRALKEMGVTKVWVSIVEAADEKTKLEIALSDNDRAGTYDEMKLAELLVGIGEFPENLYSVDLGEPVDVKTVVEMFAPDDEPPPHLDVKDPVEATCPKCGHKFTL